MSVRRTLPHRDIRTLGAWCFVDDYGPTGPTDALMSVPPHPHTGLQTVTWLLEGRVAHRDSTGGVAEVMPGELAIMTSGWGIAHSEYTTSDPSTPLRGVQMWVALPDSHRHTQPHFNHYPNLPRVRVPSAVGEDLEGVVMVGGFAGVTSPAEVFTPLVGVQLSAAGAVVTRLPLRADFEYGLLALDAPLEVDGEIVPVGALRYLGWGADEVTVSASESATLLLLGGAPLAEDLVMWWNFVGRSHEDVASARSDWESGSQRFAAVVDDANPRLPAPMLPNARLTPRPGRRST
jgi:redox-sensitive bicupin YhaK (pirin superfamily)